MRKDALDSDLTLPIEEVVRELVDLLDGHRVVALIARVNSTRDVVAWISSRERLDAARELTLRTALKAARLLADTYGKATAATWFVGANSRFNSDSPARIVRDGGTEAGVKVLLAAREFTADG